MGRLMHLMMHAKFRVHVRLGSSVGIRLTAFLIINRSYTPLCHKLAPTHVAAAVEECSESDIKHIEDTQVMRERERESG